METEKLLQLILDTADEFKAQAVTVLHVSDHCDFADYFVFMSGTSTTQIKSLAEELHFRAKHAGHPVQGEEGREAGEWCLLDFGQIVAHIFLPEKRAHYNLEELWRDAPVVWPPGDRAGE